MRHARLLGEILPEEPIGVFGGASLPGMVGGREVEAGARGVLDVPVAVEFGSVVDGDGSDPRGGAAEERDGAPSGLSGVSGGELTDQEIAGLAIDQGEDGVLIGVADHGVAFEVAPTTAVLSSWGPFGDGPLAGEAAPAVVTAIALPTLLLGAAEEEIKGAPVTPISPDVPVDAFVADVQEARPAEATCDLLRAPLLLETGEHESPVPGVEALVPAGAGASPASVVIGYARPVLAPRSIPRIAAGLPGDRASVAAQGPRDLRRPEPLSAKGGKLISLSWGELAVRPHESLPVLGGSGRL